MSCSVGKESNGSSGAGVSRLDVLAETPLHSPNDTHCRRHMLGLLQPLHISMDVTSAGGRSDGGGGGRGHVEQAHQQSHHRGGRTTAGSLNSSVAYGDYDACIAASPILKQLKKYYRDIIAIDKESRCEIYDSAVATTTAAGERSECSVLFLQDSRTDIRVKSRKY